MSGALKSEGISKIVPRGIRWLKVGIGLVALVIGVMGGVVVCGWYLERAGIIRMYSNSSPMAPNTALLFALSGAALAANLLGYTRALRVMSVLVGVFAFLILSQDLFRIDIGIDRAFFSYRFLATREVHPGRLSPIASSSFILVGIGLWLMAGSTGPRRSFIVACIGMLVGGTGAAALFGHAIGLEKMYAWGDWINIAAPTAFGLSLVGCGFFLAALQKTIETGGGAPRWLPLPVGIALTIFSIILWRAVLAEGVVASLGFVVLSFGVAGSLLISGGIYLMQRLHLAHRLALKEIAERERAEKELLRQREWLRVTLTSIGDAVIACDTEKRITFLNPIAAALTGWRSQESIGQPVECVLKTINVTTRIPNGDIVDRVLSERLISGTRNHSAVIARNGRETPIEENAAPILDSNGNLAGVVVVFRDVTEQKRLEAQLRQSQKMESVGHLAGGVAHDFNNVLTVIQGHADLLLGAGDLAPEKADSVREISEAASRCANLTRQLLTFSRRQIMMLRVLDLNEVVTSMGKMLRRVLWENILLRVENSPGPAMVFADQGMMEQIVLNLVVNSRDAMPLGGELVVKLSTVLVDDLYVSQQPLSRVGEFICLDVTDTGAGIAPEDLPLIFEPFFTTKDVGKGTGLGLATVYGIVKQHKGWIEVSSELGKGTRFRVLLPVCSEAD